MAQPELASRSFTLTSQLREATASIREDRELLAGRVSWLDYRLFLARMYGFHAVLERALVAVPRLTSVIPDAGLRNHKASLLAADLVSLGVDRHQLAQLPRMQLPAGLPLALPEALGWSYVVESSTLLGKQLIRHLTRQLPQELLGASAYLRCYGDDAPERWRQLSDALDAFEHADRDGDRVIAAACEGYMQLRTWMHPVTQPRPSRIHA